MRTPEKETPTPKTVEEVVTEMLGLAGDIEYASNKQDQKDAVQAFKDTLRTTLLAQNQAADERLRAVLEEIADEIPEAYGWGEKDDEADRGYRICSKNVKAMIRKRAAKHGITNL